MALCSGDDQNQIPEEERATVRTAPYHLLVPREAATNSPQDPFHSLLKNSLGYSLLLKETGLSSISTVNQEGLPIDAMETRVGDASGSEISSRSNSPKNGLKQTSILPPCRVCGDGSSGFHYGSYTCEACKVFYRRSLKKTIPYKCNKGGNCQIHPHKRLTCSHCRLKKCAAVGMSRQSIKRGRYTLEKKTDCIREVKELQKKRVILPDVGSEPDTTVEDSPGRVPQNVPAPVDDMTILYDEVIQKLCRNSLRFNSYDHEILDNIEASHAKHLEELKAIEEVFGPLKLLSQEEYNDLYRCTGIDVDGRLEEVATHLPNLELRIQHMVSFAKTLPGFKDFAVEDQINQIKSTGFDYFMLLSFAAMNIEYRLYTCACGHTRTDKELGRMINVELVDEMFTTAKHLQRLELTPEELGLLKAYCILSPDRGDLKEPHKVRKAFKMIEECMMYYFGKHRANEKGFIGRLTSALLSIRTSTHFHEIHILQMLKNFSANLDFPPLMLELIAS